MKFLPRNCVALLFLKEYARCVSTNIHGLYVCEGLTEGIAFVVKCKKSKIRWRIMHAFQFSTMHTIIDAFLGIRSKKNLECAQ